MIKKPTLFLLGVLCLLGALAWWMEKNPSLLPQTSTATPTLISNPLADWDLAGTRMIQYRGPAASSITLEMGEDFSDWNIKEITGAKADSGKVMQILSELTSMQPIQQLESVPSEKSMGLDSNAKRITLVDRNDNEFEIIMGNETPISSGSYIKSNGKYYIINTPVIDNVTGLFATDGIVKATETPIIFIETPQP